MGSTNSHSGIVIQLENSSYCAGQEVTGMIHISIKKRFPSSTLYLCFIGKEYTHWTESQIEPDIEDGPPIIGCSKKTKHYKGKLYSCKFVCPVYSWNSDINEGDYSIPFNFHLPDNIPGSFSCDFESGDASISYKIKIKLSSVSDDHLTGKTPIHIIQKFDPNLNSEISESNITPLISWCCIEKGLCKLNVASHQNSYHPSQTAMCIAEIDNSESKLAVTSISSRLICSIRLKNNDDRTHFIRNTLTETSVPVTIAAGANLLNSSAVEIQIDLRSIKDLLQTMYTTKGKFIECSYNNEVEVEMDGCICCGNQPKIGYCMNIVPNLVMSQATAPLAPPDWNPMVFKPIEIMYDSKYEV